MTRRGLEAFSILGCLFLVLSQTQMVVRAQQVTLNATKPTNSSAQAQEQLTAKLLANAFADLSADLAALGNNGTVPQMAANGTASSIREALRTAVLQQQSVGGLTPIKNAAETVAAFLNLPSTIGTGINMKLVEDKVKNFKLLRDSVKDFLTMEQLDKVDGALRTATQLLLQFVGAYPLAELAFFVGLIALGAAFTSLLAGIFFVVSSALAVAANSAGLANMGESAGLGRTTGKHQWVQSIQTKAAHIQKPILGLAFSNTSVNMLDMADNLLGMSQAGFLGLTDITKRFV